MGIIQSDEILTAAHTHVRLYMKVCVAITIKHRGFGAQRVPGARATMHCDSRPGRTLHPGVLGGKVLRAGKGSFYRSLLRNT